MMTLKSMAPNLTVVSIGIQARSTSKRFPNKVTQLIGKRTMLEHVIDAANKSAIYINNWNRSGLCVDTSLLIPFGDHIRKFARDIGVIEGPEDDVLARYVQLQLVRQSDYLVRITADCPLLPPFIISKAITIAKSNGYDYLSNVDERCRTAIDGYDCEVISAKALEYLNENATGLDREHVTTLLRRVHPIGFKYGTMVGFLDMSEIHLSVDTEKDLEAVRNQHGKAEAAFEKAIDIFGKGRVHQF